MPAGGIKRMLIGFTWLKPNVESEHQVCFCLGIIKIKKVSLTTRLHDHAIGIPRAGIFGIEDIIDHEVQINFLDPERRKAISRLRVMGQIRRDTSRLIWGVVQIASWDVFAEQRKGELIACLKSQIIRKYRWRWFGDSCGRMLDDFLIYYWKIRVIYWDMLLECVYLVSA